MLHERLALADQMPQRSIRADDETWERAKRLARNATATGVSVSEWIREAINKAWREKYPTTRTRKLKP